MDIPSLKPVAAVVAAVCVPINSRRGCKMMMMMMMAVVVVVMMMMMMRVTRLVTLMLF